MFEIFLIIVVFIFGMTIGYFVGWLNAISEVAAKFRMSEDQLLQSLIEDRK